MRTRRAAEYSAAGRAAAALAVLFCLLLAAGAAALARPVTIGVHGGPNIPDLQGGTNEVSEGYSSRLAPYFGVSAEVQLRSGLSLHGEINYSSQGGTRNGMQPIAPDPSLPLPPGAKIYASFDNEAILDYLEIPIMARLRWGTGIRLFADAGPYVGFLVHAKTVTKGSSLMYDESGAALPYPEQDFGAETDIKRDINSTNAGLAGGLGLEVPYGPGDVVIEARFSYGLRNIQKDTAVNGENNTGSLAFALGYTYPFGPRP
jgi:opacity protein-like surface antigen